MLTPAGGWTPLPGGWKLAARRDYRAEPSSPAVRTQNPGTVCRMAPVCVRDQLPSEIISNVTKHALFPVTSVVTLVW